MRAVAAIDQMSMTVDKAGRDHEALAIALLSAGVPQFGRHCVVRTNPDDTIFACGDCGIVQQAVGGTGLG